MKKRLHKLPAALYAGLLLLLLLLLPGAGIAGTAETAPEAARDLTALSPEELMKIEVELVYGASKFQQRVTEAPSSVSIITSDEIRKYGYRTLADILRSLRGFYITYDRNYSYVGVRGFGRAGEGISPRKYEETLPTSLHHQGQRNRVGAGGLQEPG